MKVLNNTTLLVLAKTESKGIKDPSKMYYSLVVMQDADAGSISCPQEIYEKVNEGETCVFATEYNQKYESFKIVELVGVRTADGKVAKAVDNK